MSRPTIKINVTRMTNGLWFWDIESANGAYIGVSAAPYCRKWTCVRAVKNLMKNLKDAEIVYG